ncbi:MAG: rod shape-determining protein RodA [Eubacteriales bacterium]|nr:rod shape-determining protein RodA [Eubacteriales bacterium]
MLPITKKSWKYFDVPLVAAVVLLFVIGTLMVGNATGTNTTGSSDWRSTLASMNTNTVRLHITWFLSGVLLAAVVVYFDYYVYRELQPLIYWGSVALLVLVLVLGKTVFGATSWFRLGNRGFQPSEIAKIAMIITLAKLFSQYPKGIQNLKELGRVLFYVAIPLALIILQNDLGTGMVFMFITIVLLFVSGTNWKILAGLTGLGLASLYPIWLVLGDTQRSRILVFLDPAMDPLGDGYNVIMSKMAVGSGGLTGKGFFAADTLSQLKYIPVQSSDFIFSVTAETVGFFVSALVILLYMFIIIRMLVMSRRTFDCFGSYIIVGVLAMMSFHIFENIGMALGVMPVTGIPLPFFSYGGSSMWTNLLAMGLVINVLMRRKRGIFKEGEAF